MPSKLANYPTAELAHLKINSLLVKLGRQPLPESEMIAFMDDYLARVDELEAELAAKPSAPAQPTATTAEPAANVDGKQTTSELRGIARAAAAQREGRTAKPTPKASTTPLTGVMRAAAAQDKLSQRKKS